MTRRISASQFQNLVRQAQQKQRQAIDKYNQAVRQHNQNVRNAVAKVNTAISRHNQEVRAYNSRVRANRARLSSLLSQFGRQTTTTRYVVYRSSVRSLRDAYANFEYQVDSQRIGPEYNRYADLAERETANSVDVANQLLGVDSEGSIVVDSLQNAELGNRLRLISSDLDDRWRGAVFALSPSNPDAARHFCTSAREIFTQILEQSAPDAAVFSTLTDAQKTDRGNATRRSKIRFLLHQKGMVEETLEEFAEVNMENVVDLFQVFNDGTHGSAGAFSRSQLAAIRKRVEDGITFLTEIVGGR